MARIEAVHGVTTVDQLADGCFERMINGRWKHPNIVRRRIENDSVKPHVAERCLNQKPKGVEGACNRHDYFDEQRRALEAWEQ